MGEQVETEGLIDRIKSSRLLAYASEDKKMIGVTALKNPSLNYRNGVFKKAGVAPIAKQFPLEIGYAFTLKAFRGKGIHQQLVRELIKATAGNNYYATTKAENVPAILEKLGFQKTGHEYQNPQKEKLHLFTYKSS